MPETTEAFPIGGFGEGSAVIIDRVTGKVLMLIHDCADAVPLEEAAGNFKELL